jgi:hypothetical protein
MSDTTMEAARRRHDLTEAANQEGIPPSDSIPAADLRDRVPGSEQRLLRLGGVRGRLRH